MSPLIRKNMFLLFGVLKQLVEECAIALRDGPQSDSG